MTLFLL